MIAEQSVFEEPKMIDQELASIIRFVLKCAGNPKPYYWKVPEDFAVPSAYFPPPEIVSGPDTLNSYKFEYAWYIKLFHMSDEAAFVLGRNVTNEIRKFRNLLPLIARDGNVIEGKYIRIRDPKVLLLDGGACQLTIEWTSRRPYYVERSERIQELFIKFSESAARVVFGKEWFLNGAFILNGEKKFH